MSDRKPEILNRLERSRALLSSVIAQLTPEQWEMPVQDGDSRWTARQMLAHIVDSEVGLTTQVKRIAAGQETVPPDFDVNRWNKRVIEKLGDKPVTELLKSRDDARTALLQVIDGLPELDLDKRGRHASLNIMPIEEFLFNVAAHETAHGSTLAEALHIPIA